MDKPPPVEKRNHPRVPVQLPIMVTDHRNQDHHGIVSNVSRSGCCVESLMDLTVGDRLMLRLSLSSYEPIVKVEAASVRWSEGNHAGLAFLLMDTKEQERLSRYLSQRSPPSDNGKE